MGVSTVVGALSNLAGLAGLAGSGGATSDSGSTGLLAGPPAATTSDGLSNQQFVDLVSADFAGSNLKGTDLGSLWKANFKKLLASDDLTYLQELGVVADAANLTKADKQAIAILALRFSAGPKPIATIVGVWKTARGENNIGSKENLDLFREWGVCS
jgi:hypothetical protein